MRKILASLGHRASLVFTMVIIAAAAGGLLIWGQVHAAPPSHIQSASVSMNGGGTNIAKAFTSANTAGNLVVAAITWDANTSGGSVTCSDTQANSYTTAVTQWDSANGQWLAVCYAPNVKAGANTVTATFGANRQFRRMVVSEYSNVAKTLPVDVTAKNVATGTTAANNITSTAATTTAAGDLIYGAVMDDTSATAITAGTGFTQRAFANNKDLATQDMIQSSAGSVASTQTFGAAHRYLAIMVAFKAAAPTGDTTPPSAPSNLNANVVSSSQINLSWTASTDNIGVSGYKVERCQGVGCTNFAQIAAPTAASFNDTGLAPSTTYRYQVRATDAANNLSGYSAIVTAATQTGADTTPPSVPTNLTLQVVSSTQINVNWNASTDNVGVTGYKLYRNGTLVNTVTVMPTQDAGLTQNTTYSYTVSAIDAAGNESAQTAAKQATTPAVDNTPPTASMTAPALGSTVSGTVTVSANATDNVAVQDVEFLLDGVAINDDTSAPYSFAWDTTTTANGTHTLSARAHDTAGNFGVTSGVVTVQVANSGTPPLPPELIGGWSFNESTGNTSVDVTGNGNTATFSQFGSPQWDVGHGNTGGVKFNGGTLDYLSINDSATTNITGTAFTLSAWIKPNGATSNDQVVFGKFWNGNPGEPHYQYGLELDGGTRPHLWIGAAHAQMGSALATGQWSHLAVTFNGSQAIFYVNGNLSATVPMAGTITSRVGSTIRIGADGDQAASQKFVGSLDDVRLYRKVQTLAEIQTDRDTLLNPSGSGAGPQVVITSPAQDAQVNSTVTILADSDGAAGVQFYVDGAAMGPEDTVEPFAANWDTKASGNGVHRIVARSRDAAGHTNVSAPVVVNVMNTDSFQNEILATGLTLPTAMKFLPDGRMLVAELAGKIRVIPAPYLTPDPTPILTITNIGTAGVQEGIFDFALDPNFSANHYLYVYFTANDQRDRLSRFTLNADLTGTVAGSEFILYRDPTDLASDEHHAGAITFSNDGKIMFTTGEHFQGTPAQDLNSPYGKIHRINMDGTVPTDNPFYDGAGPHWDSVWALGLRNAYRGYFDAPTNRLFVGDVGGNNYDTAYEEINIGVAGANYGWPDCEFGTCGTGKTPAAYAYSHSGRDASVTGGFVYHGSQFPAGMQGNYFFADYAQNWIKRMTFDADGNVSGVFNFEPFSGVLDGPYGDIVYLTEGPEGALYYVDLGYSDTSGTFGVSKIHRIRYQSGNQSPTAAAAADVTAGPVGVTVNFNSAGSADPENQPLTYSWDFGDGSALSTAANPAHIYAAAGTYSVRLTVSDGVNTTVAPPITIMVGSKPTGTIVTPATGLTFRAGDTISFSGDATDPEDGALPASAYRWKIDFLHSGDPNESDPTKFGCGDGCHAHPGADLLGIKNGTFTIPTSGHDFSGVTRYRIMLTVTDSNGLTHTSYVLVWPQKVNLTFNTLPAGQTLYIDGLPVTTPLVHDSLIGFTQTYEARNATVGGTNYTFSNWSDGGAQTHNITTPATDQTYTATYTASAASNGPVAAWSFNEASGTTAADATSNNNTATLINGATRAAGKHGNALSLDGTNDYISVPNSATTNISGSALTLSMWINPGSNSGDKVVMGKFWNPTMTSPYYQFGIETSGGVPNFQAATTSGVQTANMGTALALNQWSHLVVVFNSGQVQFYVNGSLVATRTLSVTTITARGNAMYWGADIAPSQYFKGLLDDVRVYNRALNATEVQTDMNTGL